MTWVDAGMTWVDAGMMGFGGNDGESNLLRPGAQSMPQKETVRERGVELRRGIG